MREFVGRYVDAAATKSAKPVKGKKMSWISKLAYVALGAAVSVPTMIVASAGDSRPNAFEVTLSIHDSSDQAGESLNLSIETTLPLDMSGQSIIHVPHDGNDGYDIRLTLSESDQGVYDVAFTICWQIAGGQCEMIAAPRLKTAFAETARINLAGGNGDSVRILLKPVLQSR